MFQAVVLSPKKEVLWRLIFFIKKKLSEEATETVQPIQTTKLLHKGFHDRRIRKEWKDFSTWHQDMIVRRNSLGIFCVIFIAQYFQ